MQKGKPHVPKNLVTTEHVVAIINKLRGDKDAYKKYQDSFGATLSSKTTEQVKPPTEEDISLYNKVNKECSLRMPKPESETILDEEKVGQKRPNKEELTRGHMISSESENEEESVKKEEQATTQTQEKSTPRKKNKKKN